MAAERNYHGGPWRCFHCDEVFTTVGAASDHFGPHPAATPGCVIDKILPEGGTNTQQGLGLLMALRKAEAELARYREEDTDLHRALHAKDCERNTAVMRAEEQGYARGLRDAQPAMQQALDALEMALAGLEWYRDGQPEHVNGSDDEADEVIGNAMQALRDLLPDGVQLPVEGQPK